MLADYRQRRKEMLLALLDKYADRVDASADELGRFFDHLRQVGIRGLLAEQLNDLDLAVEPLARRSNARRPAGSPPPGGA